MCITSLHAGTHQSRVVWHHFHQFYQCLHYTYKRWHRLLLRPCLQGREHIYIGSPGGEAGSMYTFTGQATWRRERSVSNNTHYNVLEIKCAATTQFVGHALTSECYCKSRYVQNYIEHLIFESNVMLTKPHLHKYMMLYTAYYQLSFIALYIKYI